METSLGSFVARRGVRLAHCLVVDKRRVALARERIEIAEALAHHEIFVLAVGTLGERPEGALVMADGVIVGVESARPVPRGTEIHRPSALVTAQGEMMTERLEVL